jgi:sirohydrochlorin cobaltochelatase
MEKMKILSKVVILLFIASIIAIIPVSVMAHGFDVRDYRDDDRPDKAGILVISLVPRDAPTATKQKYLEERIKENFPGLKVYWAFFEIGGKATNAFITEGERMSPKMMLNQMEEDGVTHVAILPLSIIPGETYARLVWMVNTLRTMPTRFRKITLARPFFSAPEDIRQTCQTVLGVLPEHSGNGEAVVLFFEEQSRIGDYIYPGLQYYFWQLDERVFIGTAGTSLGVQDVARSLKELKADRISLMPFLPYQSPTLALWKKSLEDGGKRTVQIAKLPVVGQEAAMDVLILRLKKALNELGFAER